MVVPASLASGFSSTMAIRVSTISRLYSKPPSFLNRDIVIFHTKSKQTTPSKDSNRIPEHIGEEREHHSVLTGITSDEGTNSFHHYDLQVFNYLMSQFLYIIRNLLNNSKNVQIP